MAGGVNKRMPVSFKRTYLQSGGYFMPGEPVGNEGMNAFIAPLNRLSERIKRRVLAENGIRERYYAIDAQGKTVCSNAQLASGAIRDCLRRGGVDLSQVTMLAAGSAGGDTLMPGFAAMIQGELAAQPMEALSVHGICVAGVSAIQAAAQAIELGAHRTALAVASEMPSRLFKRSRFASRDYQADFDSHFLRWMLSDGAGAVLLTDGAGLEGARGTKLKLKWIHQRSFAGDYPVCMQLGLTSDRAIGHLDFGSWAEAEAAGALSLRQDVRLLPHLFDIAIHEYAALVRDGWVDPARVDHFLCHYSSEKFSGVVDGLMTAAGLAIPRDRWYSNLAWRGNTGAASILIMLAEFLQTHRLKPGAQVFCCVPESGRFTTAYMLFEVDGAGGATGSGTRLVRPAAAPASGFPARDQGLGDAEPDFIGPPHDPAAAPTRLRSLLTELAGIWQDYRSGVWRTPLVRQIRDGRIALPDYVNWMAQWIPQVREGSLWMREGAASLGGEYAALAALIDTHAGEEQHDFNILFDDYRKAGGLVDEIASLRRNPGGEALNAYLHGLAATPNPIGLLGAIYIIEGTGQRIVPALLPLIKASLRPAGSFHFLDYHGKNDARHLGRWLQAIELAMALDTSGRSERRIVETARQVAALYTMQFEHITGNQ